MNDRVLTYEQLNIKANQIAHFLVGSGVKPGDIVGVCFKRSENLIAVILGILKAGAGYLPLDPEYPSSRLNFMLTQSKTKIVLIEDSIKSIFNCDHQDKLTIFESLDLRKFSHKNPSIDCTNSKLGYVIYTSGSTGTPKGVAMAQSALVNLIEWQNKETSLAAESITLQFTPISFDVHFQEIFSTLTLGGKLVLLSEDERLDTIKLLNLIIDKKVNRLYLPYVALNHLAEVAVKFKLIPKSLKEITTAGEQLKITPAIRSFLCHLDKIKLFNHYGPTETHVVTSLKLEGDPKSFPDLPSIGRAITNVECHILDKELKPTKIHDEGELYIKGAALALGYLHAEDLTKERFIEHFKLGRIYKTGDLVRICTEGNIECLGRIDTQVKIRGYRIEIGEIEVAIQKLLKGKASVVKAIKSNEREAYLCAYFKKTEEVDFKKLRSSLKAILPDYMIPGLFINIADFPLTPSGKVDYKNLPAPSSARPELANEYVAPQSDLEKTLHKFWKKFLIIDKIGIEDNFFDLGGTSLMAIKILVELNQELQQPISIAEIFQYPTIKTLCQNLELKNQSAKKQYDFSRKLNANDSHDIAVIGMTGRFPGASSIDELWENLVQRKNELTSFHKENVNSYVLKEAKNDSNYVFFEGEFPEQATFDHKFFGMTPREAELMDPQQRKFLEICYEALELAGYNPENTEHSIGIFAGMGNSKYSKLVDEHPDKIQDLGEFNVMLGLEKDYIATRIAYKLNLKGPALSIHTGCSTSLVAIIEACLKLRSRSCDMALAGGISISGAPKTGHLFIEGGILSSDGACRPFDSEASGTVFSDGAGVVVLKRLEDAIKDQDTILAIVKGVGLNNDGANKMSFTAPSVDGQMDAIIKAQIDGGIHPETIGFVEAHGTATPIGDPIEVDALTKAFKLRTLKNNYCVLSSVKSNLGHLTAASGVTSFIKTVLILNKGIIPGTAHFKIANPLINFNETPFIVTNENLEFKKRESAENRRAAVSSFGVGGTNAHLILEEFKNDEIESFENIDVYKIFKVSAKTEKQLSLMKENLVHFLSKSESTQFEKIAFTLDVGRKPFKYKAALVIKNKDELIFAQKYFVEEKNSDNKTLFENLIFTFPGQGSQYGKMGLGLYDTNLIFRSIFDLTTQTINNFLPYDLKEIIFSDNSDELLANTYYSQPAIFALEYSLAKMLMTLGYMPTALIGHSIGEFAAATIAGVFTLEEAAMAITKRAELISRLPKGKMLSVSSNIFEVEKHLLNFSLDIAAVNGQKSVVVSGNVDELARYKKYLEDQAIASIELKTSHAFHSRMMDPIIEEYLDVLKTINFQEPKIKIISSVNKATAASLLTPEYWANHIRATVNFVSAIESLQREITACVYLEVGTNNTTANLIKKELINLKNISKVLTLLSNDFILEEYSFKKALGALWILGINSEHEFDMYPEEARVRVKAPTYIFEKNHHWLVSNRIKDAIMSNSDLINLEARLIKIFESASGIDVGSFDKTTSFLEMGMDSLFLTQVSIKLKKDMKVNITFRQLLENYSSIEKLAIHLEALLPTETKAIEMPLNTPIVSRKLAEDRPIQKIEFIQSASSKPMSLQKADFQSQTPSTQLDDIIKKQLEIMANQLALLSGAPSSSSILSSETSRIQALPNVKTPISGIDIKKSKETFGAQAKIILEKTMKVDEETQKRINDFQKNYNDKTKGSKKFAQDNRKNHADPRVVTGFKPESKEFVYPIVVKKSYLQTLWDIDNNRYIDMTCGFGSNFFGNGNERIKKYVQKQIEEGFELGPQHPLVSEVSKLINELTGNERTAFCNTGSEAVLGAMRIARTVTGREKIIVFSGSYHGINDEVILRGSKNMTSYPAAPGINNESVTNMIVLDYGTDESLEFIREHAITVAAVLVEPVQSRRSDFHPKEFLKEVRRITSESETCLIFDEIITGFRVHPAGAQGYFDIRADLCTYGKILGGGMPIGVISGKTEYMDALDGGHWQYGDNSTPSVGVTYFAGTFVRHPLALAAALGALEILKEGGIPLLQDLNIRAQDFVDEINGILSTHNIPLKVDNFGSLMKPKWKEDLPSGDLFFAALRYNGIHVYDGFPWFVNLAHTKEDLEQVISSFKKSVQMMEEIGIFKRVSTIDFDINAEILNKKGPPMTQARIGKDENGNPAWFIEDENNPGQYFQIKAK